MRAGEALHWQELHRLLDEGHWNRRERKTSDTRVSPPIHSGVISMKKLSASSVRGWRTAKKKAPSRSVGLIIPTFLRCPISNWPPCVVWGGHPWVRNRGSWSPSGLMSECFAGSSH